MPARNTPVLSHGRRFYARQKLEQRKRYQMPKLRVLRLTMIMALMLCGVKLVNVYQGGRILQLELQKAYAEEKPKAEAKEEAKAKEDAPAADAKASKKEGNEAVKAPPANTPDQEALEQQMAKLQEQNDALYGRTKEFSDIEVSLLQSLRERRDLLEERSREMDLKEKLLEATELRINDKITDMKGLEQRITQLLEQYGKQEETHIRGLVKIYENMKPKSAATIFDELDMPILLEVIDRMSERKVAPILAAMDPLKAKEVTTDLAALRKLKSLSGKP